MSSYGSSKGPARSRGWVGAALASSLLVLIGTQACGEEGTTDPAERVPGLIVVTLVSPHGPEAAVVLETKHPGILAVTSSEGRAFLGGSDETTRLVILREVPGEITASLEVADLNQPPHLQVVEVADGTNELRADLTGYILVTRTNDAVVAWERLEAER